MTHRDQFKIPTTNKNIKWKSFFRRNREYFPPIFVSETILNLLMMIPNFGLQSDEAALKASGDLIEAQVLNRFRRNKV